jgi:hypothetical protein
MLCGIPVHNFIVLNFEAPALRLSFSSQLYFTDEENLERKINNLEGV